MEPIKIRVEYDDMEYNHALEKALVLSSDIFVIGETGDPDCLVLNESFISKYTPVSEIRALTMAQLNQKKPEKPQEEVQYTCFCAAIGGGGLSTTALCYARIMAEIMGKRVAYYSFDPWFRKNEIHLVPGSGLQVLEQWPCKEDVDELVIDLPFGVHQYNEILNMCDRRVVVLGYQEKRQSFGKKMYDSLVKSETLYVHPPENYLFENHFDQALDIEDIHSQLGKEVLDFAKKLQ